MVRKKKNRNFIAHILIFISTILLVFFFNHIKNFVNRNYHIMFGWDQDFEIVNIKSSIDNHNQKAYLFKSKSNEPKPLIVSLHTWNGDYKQFDELAKICKKKDVNYIHPNFRGPNISTDACCSKLAISDIDDAITFAIKNTNVDTTKINVVGVSGGGYATLCTFMKSKHNINRFSAWNSITNLIDWYYETKQINSNYSQDILDCTGSENVLDESKAKLKSPIFWKTPKEKLSNSSLHIYAGILDGIKGPVPITQSINFYNKLLSDMAVDDSLKYVSDFEIKRLKTIPYTGRNYGLLENRTIHLKKEYNKMRITIFEGDHEMLSEFAINELLED